MKWFWVLILVLINPLLGSDPSVNDLKVIRLLKNVPSVSHEFQFIEPSQYFKKNVSKYGYILGINHLSDLQKDALQNMNTEYSGLVGYYYQIKDDIMARWNLIQSIAKREKKINIYSIRNDGLDLEFLMMVPTEAEVEISSLMSWVNKYQLSKFEEDCWADRIRYGCTVRFVKFGLDPWSC